MPRYARLPDRLPSKAYQIALRLGATFALPVAPPPRTGASSRLFAPIETASAISALPIDD